MSSAIDDEELSISLPAYDASRSRPSLPPIISPPLQTPTQAAASQSPGTIRSHHRLNQYREVKNLGEGSFGKVKLAQHKVTGQEVAMKIISRRKLVSRDMAGRVEREIQYLQLLRHPHIIKLYTVIATKLDIIMVLEYAPMELFDYIVRHGRLGESRSRKFFQQIICAVEYCHRHKIVHRDLKPENLLLDQNMNVKIADFGLSNIMTDGNFLKTSCGSPNYAAPEVILGRLYAGPEVDVWSCGVILYVFLVGRLPFDDEYIPALFKKIQGGKFAPPSHAPPGAVRIIQGCLNTSATARLTIPEIRQDEWFDKDLPAYLREPADEFLDTVVDPTKAIDPRQLAPGKPPEVVERIHESVVGKLGKTMGYAREDVKDALSKDEPSAIKDAYLIVRENQLMKDAPQYHMDNPGLEAFLATSPPVEPNYPQMTGVAGRARSDIKPLTSTRGDASRTSRTLSDATAAALREEAPPRNSNVRILNTSLPYIHNDLITRRRETRDAGEDPDLAVLLVKIHDSPIDPSPSAAIPEAKIDPKTKKWLVRPKEEQEATARALKPHSRSVTAMNELRAMKDRPEGMTPTKTGAPSKPKPKKWQFGIRSRNAPYEAMKCLYNALEAQGAEWEVIPALAYDGDGNSEEEGSMPPPPQLANGERHTILQSKFPHMPRDYYVPRDPWFIRAKMLKRGMFHPGEGPAFSAQNSSANLAAEQFKNRVEQEGGYVGEDLAKIGSPVNDATSNSNPGSQPGSGHPTRPNSSVGENAAAGQDAYTGPGQLPSRVSSMLSSLGHEPNPDIGVWVFIDIQLYMLESQTYMVDFKCDGYQNVHFVEVDSTRSPQTGSSSRLASPAVSRPASGLDALRHSDSMNGDRNDHEHSDTSWTGRVGDWRPVSKRYKGKEKEITSPYPYLDVASDLIAQLAVQN